MSVTVIWSSCWTRLPSRATRKLPMANCVIMRCLRVLLGAALLLPLCAQAQQARWYQVEVLVFSYPAGGAAELWEATPKLAYPTVTQRLSSAREQSAVVPQADPVSLAVATQPVPFATLPATQRELARQADAMQRSGRYRILFHEAWLQPMANQAEAVPIVLDHSGDGGPWPALQGTIKLYQSGDLQLETNLWLNTQGEYLHSSWRMPPPPLAPSSGIPETPPQSAPDAPGAAAPAGKEYPFQHAVLLNQTRHLRNGELLYIDHPMMGVLAKITAVPEAPPTVTAQPETKPSLPPPTPTPPI
jgi:hypothetical protein